MCVDRAGGVTGGDWKPAEPAVGRDRCAEVSPPVIARVCSVQGTMPDAVAAACCGVWGYSLAEKDLYHTSHSTLKTENRSRNCYYYNRFGKTAPFCGGVSGSRVFLWLVEGCIIYFIVVLLCFMCTTPISKHIYLGCSMYILIVYILPLRKIKH